MNQNDLDKMIRDIVSNVVKNDSSQAPVASFSSGQGVTYRDYPLAEKLTDKLRTPSGKGINDVTLEALMSGSVSNEDVRIGPETLEMQAQVAESVGRYRLAANFRRAAELIAVPDERILQIYAALRPYRSTKKELYDIADELDSKYGAKVTAGFVREAADVGEARGRLRKD